jgi:hypothetical protein
VTAFPSESAITFGGIPSVLPTGALASVEQTLQGTYKINGDNTLEWTMSGITTKSKLNVTATELELTDDANRTIKYKRR